MSESLIGLPILSASFTLALIFGAVAQKTHFCTMGGITDWVTSGNKGRLGAWLLAIAVASAGVSILELLELASVDTSRPPYRSADFAWPRYILGGLLFGIGMTLASGCTSKTLIRLGGGNLKSVIVLLGIGVTAYLMTKTSFYGIAFHSWIQALSIDLRQYNLASQDLGSLLAVLLETDHSDFLRVITVALLVVVILLFILKTSGLRGNSANWLAGVVIGLCITGGWYVTGGPLGQQWIETAQWLDTPPVGVGVQSYTFVNPLAETLVYLSTPADFLLITFGVAAVFGVISGAFLYAIFSARFRFEWFASWRDFWRHIMGSALMGSGGVLALGCTIGQGITGVSTLALGSFLALGSIMLGCAITLKVEYYRIVYEDASLYASLLSSLADLRLLPDSLRRLENL